MLPTLMTTRLLTDLATHDDQMDKKAALSLLYKTVYMLDRWITGQEFGTINALSKPHFVV